MARSVLVLAVIVAALIVYAHWTRGPAVVAEGILGGFKLFGGLLPNLILGFVLAGLAQVLVPRDLIAQYAGEESGLSGMMFATVVGALTPGGPFVQFPLVAALWKAGSGVGQITAYLTAWSLMGFQRTLIYEWPLMGWRYATARYVTCLIVPTGVGYVAAWVYRQLEGL